MAHRNKRWAPAPAPPARSCSDPVKTCVHCGKACYPSRKQARARMHVLFPGEHVSAYRCGDYWHAGHMPAWVLTGERDRAVQHNR